jgi:hypothetical protein
MIEEDAALGCGVGAEGADASADDADGAGAATGASLPHPDSAIKAMKNVRAWERAHHRTIPAGDRQTRNTFTDKQTMSAHFVASTQSDAAWDANGA